MLYLIVFYLVFAMLFHRIVYHHIELETVIRAINAQKTPANAQCERDCRLTTNHRLTSTCDNRDSKGIWEIYASIYIFNAHLLIRLYVFMLAFGGRPPSWIPLYGGWGGGKHSKNIQTNQQMCIEYVY